MLESLRCFWTWCAFNCGLRRSALESGGQLPEHHSQATAASKGRLPRWELNTMLHPIAHSGRMLAEHRATSRL